MNFGIPLGMAGVTFVLALFFGIVIDAVFFLGGNYFWVELVLAILLTVFVLWLTPFLVKADRRHDQDSLKTAKAIGEETDPRVAAAIIASHQHGEHHGGH